MEKYHQKLISSRRGLIEWSRDKFKSRREEIQALSNRLHNLQYNWEENGDQINSLSEQLDRMEERDEKLAMVPG